MKRAFQVHAADNVATLLFDADCEPVEVGGPTGTSVTILIETIMYGHKLALLDIAAGQPILKYGIPIGIATQPIRTGEWVHLHNCASAVDTRSTTLHVETGATTDTPYV